MSWGKQWATTAMFFLGILLSSSPPLAADSAASLSTLKVVWSTDVDGRKPTDALSFSSPVVTGTGKQARIIIGGADARVHIYDMQGQELYRLPIEKNSDSGAVTLASGLVVVGDSQGRLYGVDAEQGQVLWHVDLSSSVTGIPLAVGDDVVVQTTGNNLYRINAKGEKVWSFASQQGGLGLYISSSPMFHDGKLYALLGNGDAVAMDAQTGDLIWRKQLLLDTDAAMLSELKAPQAIPLWLSKVSFDGRVLQDVVLFSFYQGKTFVLNQSNGNTMLSQDRSLKSSPVLLNDTLYSVDTQGVLQAINRNTGQQQWEKTLAIQEWMGPVIWHHALWLVGQNGKLLKVSLKGDILASLDMGGSVERLPVVTNHGLLLHNTLGGLYLIH
ncbi:MAG: PQQ-like beta-propeller repeat protein [Mariprofundaceae bacterium]|nr:PQQ-like beta-propeller repeat protein [Mariprofundaceae bacterium]